MNAETFDMVRADRGMNTLARRLKIPVEKIVRKIPNGHGRGVRKTRRVTLIKQERPPNGGDGCARAASKAGGAPLLASGLLEKLVADGENLIRADDDGPRLHLQDIVGLETRQGLRDLGGRGVAGEVPVFLRLIHHRGALMKAHTCCAKIAPRAGLADASMISG